MCKNKIYTAVSFLVMLAILLPGKSIFARAETSTRERGENDEVRTGTVRQDDDEDRGESDEVRTGTVKRDNEDRGESDEVRTGTLKRNDNDRDDKARTGTSERKDEDENSTGTAKGENGEDEAGEHRSAVASFVKGLLEVADRNMSGIGEEVREVAREQGESEATTTKAIVEVKNRGWLKTFLLGTDYKNLGKIRSEIVKTQNRLNKLNGLLEAMTTSTGATTTMEQIQGLTQAQTKLEAFLKANESKFSLFGWFVKLFNRE